MKKDYVLITTARNEEANIERTIKSVIAQTILPVKWVIVNDGSTDKTPELVKKYLDNYGFIELLTIKAEGGRNFCAKVRGFNIGYQEIKDLKYDYLGVLDADVSLESHYYEFIIKQFQENPGLGIAGGLIYDVYDGKRVQLVTRLKSSVGGPVQMFRKKCYQDMKSFTPLENGGEDAVAEFMARRNGWEVETFTSVKVSHHRRMSTAGKSIWQARIFQGKRDYFLGYDPMFETAKCFRRIVERPYIIGGFLWLIGYWWAAVNGHKRTLSPDIVKYIREEQRNSLFKPFIRFLR